MQIGDYRVLGELGRGGMGVVYRAQDPTGQVVALKLLLPGRAAQPRQRQRFLQELQSLSRLRHPNLVSLLATGEHEGAPWIALDYVEGSTLQDRLHNGPLGIPETIRLVSQLANALAYVHSCGLLHRDLKPDNVLLRGEEALLTDFGLVLDEVDGDTSRLSQTGVFLGTPGYWAPEQARGEKHAYGPHTDLYGLGGVLYACLSGGPPVQAESLVEYLQTQRFQSLTPPRTVRPEVPAWLSELCLECLAPDPAGRPASAHELARRLLAGEAGQRRHPERRPAWGTRLAAAAALVLATGAALLAGSMLRSLPATPAGPEPPPPAGELSYAELLERCGDALIAGHYEQGLELAQRLTRLDTTNPEGHRALGLALLELGRHQEACAAFDQALEREPNHAATLYQRARCKLELHDEAGAATDATRSLEHDPENPEAYTIRGIAEAGLDQHATALENFERALALAPSDTQALLWRGRTLLKLGRAAETLEAATQLLDKNPESPDANLLQGGALLLLGRAAEALVYLDATLSLDPDQPSAHLLRGRARALAKDWDGALADLTTEQQRSPTWGEPFMVRGGILASLERYDEALVEFEAALAIDPEYPRASNFRGLTLVNLGRSAEAVLAFDRALILSPNDPQTVTNRGKALLELGRFAEALRDFGGLLASHSPHPETLHGQGTALMGLGRYAEAAASFTHALELDPTSTQARSDRALSLSKLGRHAEALSDYEALLADFPDSADTWLSLGKTLTYLERYEEALTSLDRAIQLDPKEPTAYTARGMVRGVVDDLDGAIADYTRGLELTPQHAGLLYLRGQAYGRTDRVPEGLADLEAALAVKPGQTTFQAARALLYYQLGRYDDALADCDRCLAVTPNDLPTLTLRGKVNLALGHVPAARADVTAGLRLAPASLMAWESAISACEGPSDYAGATAQLEILIKSMNPPRGWPSRLLGHCQLYAGEFAKAEANFTLALTRTAADAPHRAEQLQGWRAVGFALQGQLAEARAAAQAALRAQPNSWKAALWLAAFGGDAPRSAREGDPPWVAALIEAYTRTNATDPETVYRACTTPFQRAQAASLLGLLAERRDDTAAARARYAEAVSFPDRTSLLRAWAELRLISLR